MKPINYKARGTGCLIAGILFLVTALLIFSFAGYLFWAIMFASLLILPAMFLIIAGIAYLSHKERIVQDYDEDDEDYDDDYDEDDEDYDDDYDDEEEEEEEEEEKKEIEPWI